MEKLKKLLLKNITINQMNKINIATALIRPVILFANSTMMITNDGLSELFLPIYLLGEGIYCLTSPKNQHFTKHNNEIYDIYREVLYNYDKLNNSFNFSNPIEMSVLLNYAVYNGYLSKDKVFTFGSENVNDVYEIRGANILAGNATCRHISKFYKDVLALNDIHNDLIFVSRDETNDIAAVQNAILEAKELGFSDEYIEEVKLKLKKLEEENIFRLSTPTHCINYVYDGQNSYLIDPTNESLLYTFNDDKMTLKYKYYDNIKIFYDKSKLHSGDKLRKFNKNKYLQGMDEEEYNNLKKKTITYIDDNLDMLETFYNDNNEAYHEIHNLIKG